MGRHADTQTISRRPAPFVLVAVGIVVLLLAGGLVWWLAGSGAGGCEKTDVVRVSVAPELASLVDGVLEGADGLTDEDCARAEVTAQQPLQTVGDLQALDGDSLPHIWIPDSSLWIARATEIPLEPAGSLASSPVVLATSSAVVEELGWDEEAPGWGAALASPQPLAVPDLATSAEGLAALSAVRTSLGGGEAADNAVVQTVLAASRGSAISVPDGLAQAQQGGTEAPIIPVSEQEVFAINDGTPDSSLVAVYPEEGSPWLDYPVLEVGVATGADSAAVNATLRALKSDQARTATGRAGFRTVEGAPPPGAGPATGTQETAPGQLQLDPEQVQGLLQRLSSLATPSRILVAFDVSTSMRASVGNSTRVLLARDAAKSALALVPDNFALGVWTFAYHLEGNQDWAQLVPTRRLSDPVDGRTQRDVLAGQLETLPDRLTPGGTGLYDTTLAAVRAARADFDPTAVNSILVITDGTNEDDADGLTLERLLQTLRAEADPERPIKVIGVAFGPDADLSVLEQIADTSNGSAYSALDENDLQTVLFDALRQRG